MRYLLLILFLCSPLWGQEVATVGEGRTAAGDLDLSDYATLGEGRTALGGGLVPAWHGNLTVPFNSGSAFNTESLPQDSAVMVRVDLGGTKTGTIGDLEIRIQGFDTTAREGAISIWTHTAGTGVFASTGRWDTCIWSTGRYYEPSTSSATTLAYEPNVGITDAAYVWVAFSSEVRSSVAKLFYDADAAGIAFVMPVEQYSAAWDDFEADDTFSNHSGNASTGANLTDSAEVRIYVE